jgi:hypothetical protein
LPSTQPGLVARRRRLPRARALDGYSRGPAGVYCAFVIVKLWILLNGTLGEGQGQRSREESDLNTKDTIQGYFSSLKQKKDWESFLSNDMIFTSFTSPIRRMRGRAAFLEGLNVSTP